MKPESRRALMELISFGMEEISSEQAAPLLARISECTECEGQWVLIHRTIDTLSHVSETDVSNQRSQQMWLVCMEHARHKVPSEYALQDGYSGSASSGVSLDGVASSEQKAEEDQAAGIENLTNALEKMRN